MATNENPSPLEKSSSTPVPTLDESLAQLEEALDLFVSNHSDTEFDQTPILEESPSITPITPLTAPPRIPVGESVPAVAAPMKDESFEQAIKELKQKIASPGSEGAVSIPAGEVVIRPPEDEEGLSRRRFPIFTDSQKRLMLLTVIILAFFVLIGYLVWQRQRSDEIRLAIEKQENARLFNQPLNPAPSESPVIKAVTPPIVAGDQGLLDNLTQILVAYNPSAANTRYKIEVKDGVVTLNGDVQSQLEKDGVESVIKPLTGIKKIINNLAVKGFTATPGGVLPSNGPVMYPQVNPAEAKRLEEALKRDLAEGAKRAEEERLRIEQQNSQLAQRNNDDAAKQEAIRQEADRTHRQQTAAIHNEEDAAFRKLADERLKQREKEEAERRAEEQRKVEAVTKAEPPRPDPTILRSGTVTWRGVVKGTDDIVIRGSSASVQHVAGDMPKDTKGVFSAALPNAPMSVRLVAASGPSPIRIIQQPSAGNNFTTIIRVGDGNKADGKPHTFTLRWSSQ